MRAPSAVAALTGDEIETAKAATATNEKRVFIPFSRLLLQWRHTTTGIAGAIGSGPEKSAPSGSKMKGSSS
jgi:hypothetical protein